MNTWTLLWTVFIFLLSALPLHILVKILGGKTNLFKTAFVSLIAGVIVALIKDAFSTFGGLFAFVFLIWIYREAFRLKWLKAFLVWLLQGVVLFILALIFGLLFGVVLVAGMLI
jgi:hypothetical protein